MSENLKEILKQNPKKIAAISSPSDSFKINLDIIGDSTKKKILGELVYFQSTENDADIVSLGQITDVRTENKWHEEPSFKAVIKRHGFLPHLSENADNRLATLNVQSTFKIDNINDISAHKLSNSPSTGVAIHSITNDIMKSLTTPICKKFKTEILGKAYDTDVEIPFWFKHFGDGENGADEAYHIGVFGKTGSGKTTTAAYMIAGYASNHEKMSVLILDPQEQFYNDFKVLPKGNKFKKLLNEKGISEEKYRPVIIPDDISLPNSAELFADLLLSTGLIKTLFKLPPDRQEFMAQAIEDYVRTRIFESNGSFSLSTYSPRKLLTDIVARFLSEESDPEKKEECSRYVASIYTSKSSRKELIFKLKILNESLEKQNSGLEKDINSFTDIMSLFQTKSSEDINSMITNLLTKPGYVYIVNLAPRANKSFRNENFQARLIETILQYVIEKAEDLAFHDKKANCLIVMDEAHRYVNSTATDDRLKELNKKIIDSVRTVRKYGIGHMFITQTIESIDQEVIQQMRIFAFGYGLTMGGEFSKIKQIINDDNAAKFYRSFIDPSSNGKFPFMFHGPISPLSFTGSPLFIEMN